MLTPTGPFGARSSPQYARRVDATVGKIAGSRPASEARAVKPGNGPQL
jgi:hypothetical protein